MTDLSGTFDPSVLESEVDSIDDYFAMLHAAFAEQDSQESLDILYQRGQRTFYTIQASYESEA